MGWGRSRSRLRGDHLSEVQYVDHVAADGRGVRQTIGTSRSGGDAHGG